MPLDPDSVTWTKDYSVPFNTKQSMPVVIPRWWLEACHLSGGDNIIVQFDKESGNLIISPKVKSPVPAADEREVN